MLSKLRIVGVQSPRSSAIVSIDVPLRLGDRADDGSRSTLARSNFSTLSKIVMAGRTDNAGNAIRRLRHGELEIDTILGSSVADTELERPGSVLSDVSESEGLGLVVSNPACAIGGLELEKSSGSRTSGSSDRNRLGTTVRDELKEERKCAAVGRVEFDGGSNALLSGDGGGDACERKWSSNEIALSVPGLVRARGIASRVLDALHGEYRCSQVRQVEGLVRSLLSGDDTIERDSVGADVQDGGLTLASASETRVACSAILVHAVGCVEVDVGREKPNSTGLESGLDREGITGLHLHRKLRQS